jgi:hypothetical protein
MNVLLDTNILLRSVEPKHPMHAGAEAAVIALLGVKDTPCLVAQNLYEFWVVSTRPIEQNGLGLPASKAEAALTYFKSQFPLTMTRPQFGRRGSNWS